MQTYSNMTLPRAFFGRSLMERIDFTNTDLSESRMCWNDFIGCNFSRADLFECDMRASVFKECSFVEANLVAADLRGSTFHGCDFTGADLTHATADYETAKHSELLLSLTEEQMEEMYWYEEPGEEPEGG